MITGAHFLLYSTNADADRAFIRDVLGFKSVDVGRGWLIFALPPSEMAVHPSEPSGVGVEMYLMCDDVEAEVKALERKGVAYSKLDDAGWGIKTSVTLPSGGRLGLYQPKHATAFDLP